MVPCTWNKEWNRQSCFQFRLIFFVLLCSSDHGWYQGLVQVYRASLEDPGLHCLWSPWGSQVPGQSHCLQCCWRGNTRIHRVCVCQESCRSAKKTKQNKTEKKERCWNWDVIRSNVVCFSVDVNLFFCCWLLSIVAGCPPQSCQWLNWTCLSRMAWSSEQERHSVYLLQSQENPTRPSPGPRTTINLTKTAWRSSLRAMTALFQSRMSRGRTAANTRSPLVTPAAPRLLGPEWRLWVSGSQGSEGRTWG